MISSEDEGSIRANARGNWMPVALGSLAVAAALLGLSAAALVAESRLLVAVIAIFALAVVPSLVRRSRIWNLYAFSATVGLTSLGAVSFGIALLPSIIIWAIASTFDRRPLPSAAFVTIAIVAGVSVGTWSVLLPVTLSRAT